MSNILKGTAKKAPHPVDKHVAAPRVAACRNAASCDCGIVSSQAVL
jgi:hypothetical protein